MSTDDLRLAPVLLDWDADSFTEHFDAVEVFILEHEPEPAATRAKGWLGASDVRLHTLGIDVLVCLAHRDRGYARAAQAAALAVVDAVDEDLRWSGAHALSAVPSMSVAPALLTLLSDPESDIRWQAVDGLAELAAESELPADHAIVLALLRAMDDDDRDVRRWAVFQVARVLQTDSTEIRDALVELMGGDDDEFAADACLGLSLRKDPRVDEVLRAKLLHVGVESEYLEAAAERGSPEFLPLLHLLREEARYADDAESTWAFELDYAIAECSGVDSVDADDE